MANPHGTPIWYELQTPDPDAATAFYDAVMGWTIEDRPPGEMDYRMIGTDHGHSGGVARWNAGAPGAAAGPGWLMYIGVDDVDASVAALTAAGGTVSIAPFDFPGVGRMAKVADPQGVAFYLMRGATEGADSDAFSPTVMGRISWNELTTSDLSAATAFYDALFGWKVTGSMPMGGNMGDYRFLSLGTIPLGAAMTRLAGTPPAWRFYVRVADIDAAAAAIRSGGGTIHVGPVEVPGGDHVVMASDPDGLAFGAVGPRSASA